MKSMGVSIELGGYILRLAMADSYSDIAFSAVFRWSLVDGAAIPGGYHRPVPGSSRPRVRLDMCSH